MKAEKRYKRAYKKREGLINRLVKWNRKRQVIADINREIDRCMFSGRIFAVVSKRPIINYWSLDEAISYYRSLGYSIDDRIISDYLTIEWDHLKPKD